MSFATCRACERGFTKDGPGAQAPGSPRLCLDCEIRELAGHPRHGGVALADGRIAGQQSACADRYVGA